eukprot:CAMPEP_0174264292 /NCGR_PEP_ID=MMETSP0439-20130205/21983_1 /TAXON_ID=0 /ORGANISM="Stereomyxa ramosa, Strain Chinc5" /LENGTH=189 /DNA_ID=CAMNT_0015350095 /DNA_START=28 /DNA_END=597 /DNA_ORIENTATION=+
MKLLGKKKKKTKTKEDSFIGRGNEPLLSRTEHEDPAWLREKKEFKYRKAPYRLPPICSWSIAIMGVLLIALGAVLFLIYIFVIRDPDASAVSKDNVLWFIGCIGGITFGLIFLLFACYCLCCRAKFWHMRKEKKRIRGEKRMESELEDRRQERRRQNDARKERHQMSRQKYAGGGQSEAMELGVLDGKL